MFPGNIGGKVLFILLSSLPILIILGTPGNLEAGEITVVENVYEDVLPVDFIPSGSSTYTKKINVTVKLSDNNKEYSAWQYCWSNTREIPLEGWQTFTFNRGRYSTEFSGNTGDWYLHISAINENGNKIYSCSDKYLIDITPPVLKGLDLEVLGPNLIIVKGQAEDKESGLDGSPFRYKCNGEVLNSIWVKGEILTSFLQPNTFYYFQFQARDIAGNESQYSEPVGVYTWAEVPEFRIGEVTHCSVEVGVFDNNPEYTKYHLEYADNEFFHDSKKVNFVGSKFLVNELDSLTTYYFRLRAENGDGVCTDWSPTLTVKTLLSIPDLKVNNRPDQVNLTWEKVKGALGYKIYRDGELLITLGDVNTYADLTASPPVISPGEVKASKGTEAEYVLLELKGAEVNPGPCHEYYIVAFNDQGESLPSPVIKGWRVPGPLEIQWQYSEDDSEENFVNIPNASTPIYRDISAPDYLIDPPEVLKVVPLSADSLEIKFSPGWVAPGESRYYRAVLKALGVEAPVITNIVEGFRGDVLILTEKYEIYRAEKESGEYKLIGYSSEPVFRDTFLKPNTRYYYQVKIRTQAGRSSEFTGNYGCAYTLAQNPQMLKISQVTTKEIVFDIIEAVQQKEAEYKIEVKNKGAGIEGISVGYSDFSYKVKERIIGGLEPGQEYEVWVTTRNNDLISNPPIKMINSVYTKHAFKKKNADDSDDVFIGKEYHEPKPDMQNQVNPEKFEYFVSRYIVNYFLPFTLGYERIGLFILIDKLMFS